MGVGVGVGVGVGGSDGGGVGVSGGGGEGPVGVGGSAGVVIGGEVLRGRRWHSVQPSRKRVTASRGRNAYVSVICNKQRGG